MLLTSSGDAWLRGRATEGHPENGVGVGSQPVSSTSVQSCFPPDPLPLSTACSSRSDPAHHPTRSLKVKGFFCPGLLPFFSGCLRMVAGMGQPSGHRNIQHRWHCRPGQVGLGFLGGTARPWPVVEQLEFQQQKAKGAGGSMGQGLRREGAAGG